MTVTINTLGPSSRQIVITGETSATNIIAAVDTSLVSLGWTLYDTVTSGSRGLLTTKVYSAPNADSITTKYMIIRYDLHRQYWFVSCCESWNAATNVATNESWYGGRGILLPLQYSNTILYVFASPRYACFMGVVLNEPGPWQGVFEFERIASEDVAANSVPCFGWTSSLTIGEPYGNWTTPTASFPTSGGTSASNGPVACGFAPPRTASGITGINAANTFTVITGLGQYPIQKSFTGIDWSSGGITQAINSHCGMLGAFGENMRNYVWDSNSTVFTNLWLGGYTQFYPTGKIYGLKLSSKIGNPLDTIIVPVDANLFYDPAGVNTRHCLMGIHGGYKDKLSTGVNKLTALIYTSGTALGSIAQTVVVGGRFIYFTTNTGFHKFDLINKGFKYNVLPASSAAYSAVKFDGGNNLYVTTGKTTMYKLNLSDDSYTTLTTPLATFGIQLDDAFLYTAARVSTTITIYKISLSTFTITSTYTITGDTGGGVTHMSTANYDGYLYIGSLADTGTRANCRIYRVLTADGTNTSLSLPAAGYNNLGGAQTSFFDGDYLYFWTGTFSNGSGANFNAQAPCVVKLSNFTLDRVMSDSDSSANNSQSWYTGPSATAGSTENPMFAGIYMIFYASNTATLKTVYIDPRNPTGISYVSADTAALDSANGVKVGQPATDHCSYYTFNTTQVIKYVGAFRNCNFNGVQTSNILLAQ